MLGAQGTTLARKKFERYRVWKRTADGCLYPISEEMEVLRNVAPDCATCTLEKGLPIICDSVRWKLRSGRYYVTVRCHGQEETRVVFPNALEGAERVVVEPAFRPALAIVLVPRAPLAPAWLVKLLTDAVRRAGRWLGEEL